MVFLPAMAKTKTKTVKKKASTSSKSAKPRKSSAGTTARKPAKAAKFPKSAGSGADPKRVAAILAKLDEAYPAAICELKHENAFQLLISTILSAQCTDVRVNEVTQTLYKKYTTPEAFAYANPSELQQEIRPTGFFRNKTKSIMGASKAVVETFGGQVPRTMEEILTLPGVARKTANVVLGTAYGIASGVVVDTHVMRLSRRLDLTKHDDPKKIEQDLIGEIPREKWIQFSHQLIWHGRRVCTARKPKCMECNLESICYSRDKTVASISPAIGSAAPSGGLCLPLSPRGI
jgi:endonuclease-3